MKNNHTFNREKTSQEKNNQMTDTFASGRNDDKVGVITLH